MLGTLSRCRLFATCRCKAILRRFFSLFLRLKTAFTVLANANLYRIEPLQTLAYQMISDRFDEFMETDDLKSFKTI